MRTEAFRVHTGDGFPLFGLGHGLDEAGTAVLYVHGLGGNGFTLFSDDLAEALPAAGYPFLRGNLREAELLRIDEFPSAAEVRKGGGAFHRFDDCVPDIRAWLDQAESTGHDRVVLLGHSLGSLKATHYLARTQDPRVAGLVLASTADLIAMHEARYSPEERRSFESLAQRMVREGSGEELMPAECAMGLMRQPVSAASYLDRFGPVPAWDVMDLAGRGSARAFSALRQVRVPVLALFGTVSETVAAEEIEPAFERLRRAAVAAPSFTTDVLEGANHFYTGHGARLAAAMLTWLNSEVKAGDREA